MIQPKVVVVFILCWALVNTGCGEETVSDSNRDQPEFEGTIVALGDSLTEGLGVAEELAYPALLQRKLLEQGYKYTVINAGVSGETSSGALSRIKWALTLNPDIVILVTGANDGLRGIDIRLIKSNIIQIIQILKAQKIIVVLGGMQMVQNLGRDYAKAFSGIYPEIAQIHGLILIPFFLAGVAGEQDLNQADGIHPTAGGYRIIVESIFPYVLEAINIHRAKQDS